MVTLLRVSFFNRCERCETVQWSRVDEGGQRRDYVRNCTVRCLAREWHVAFRRVPNHFGLFKSRGINFTQLPPALLGPVVRVGLGGPEHMLQVTEQIGDAS